MIYHGSGNGPPFNDPNFQIFEAINPQGLVITPIPISGDIFNASCGELTALVHQSNNVLLAGTIDGEFYSITTSGETVFLGDMDHITKGLAFNCGIPEQIPTLSEWGLITTVIALGLVSFFVLRRRSALQK
ncbi:MAG: IPTL-CTERM sorting domain-containing protein [Candidatus Dadabacteria bacterium]|nr:IPTL-CTERM sorting domain-containing protein [Candidatus Dadabacteria bacterium]